MPDPSSLLALAAALPADTAAASLGWWRLLLIPVIGGLIGWGTNALAVKMIFRPHRPVRILGFTLQGLVPKRQGELAANIGQTVEEHLISHEDVARVLAGEGTQRAIDAMVREKLSLFVDQRLGKIHPMIGVFLQGEMRQRLENLLLEEIQRLAPRIMDQMFTRLESELDFRAIVEEKVRQFDLERLESIIFDIARRELKAIEVLGGLLGFLIGLVQMAILMI